jgi:uncharacterized protein
MTSSKSSSKTHLQLHREALQRRTQQDWANREYVEVMSSSVTRVADFLNTFNRYAQSVHATIRSALTQPLATL